MAASEAPRSPLRRQEGRPRSARPRGAESRGHEALPAPLCPALPAGLKAIVLRVGGFRRVRLFQQEELVRETRSLLHVNNMGFIKNQEKKKPGKLTNVPIANKNINPS